MPPAAPTRRSAAYDSPQGFTVLFLADPIDSGDLLLPCGQWSGTNSQIGRELSRDFLRGKEIHRQKNLARRTNIFLSRSRGIFDSWQRVCHSRPRTFDIFYGAGGITKRSHGISEKKIPRLTIRSIQRKYNVMHPRRRRRKCRDATSPRI